MAIDFDAIDAALFPRARSLVEQWLPGGRWKGNEYWCSGFGGGSGDSMHVTIKGNTVEAFDFASPADSAVGMIGIYAKANGLRNGEAAKQLADSYNLDGVDASPPPRSNGNHGAPQLPAPQPAAATPAPTTPPDPPEPPAAGHTALYRYSATWFIARHDKPDGSKTFRPWRWTGGAWEPKAPEKPRPLYRMADAPPDAPLLIVEGEKACHAAAGALPSHHVITWAGGASAVGTSDWSGIRGRAVVIWPDADEPGRAAAARIAALLLKQECAVRLMDPPDDWDAGYDAADAVADGLDLAALVAGAKPLKGKTSAAKQDDAERPSYLTWQDWGLSANERGPYPTEANCLLILGNAPNFSGRIWLDEFSQRLMIDDEAAKHGCREFSRTDAITALVWMQHELKLPKMGLAAVERAALLIGHRQKRHPVKDWFATLEWDGVDRLPKLLADGWGAEQTEYTAAVGTNWMVGMVARVFDPGCKADNCVIFEGAQGTRKSSSLRALIGDRWFYECNIDPVRKPVDFSMSTQGRLFMEIPEVDRYMRGDRIRDMVALVSTQEDTYRAPYAPTVMSYPRQCAVGGSTNKAQLYDDPDGSRRWWPFIVREVNMEFILETRKLLWAEAIARYKRGETWWRVPEDAARAAQLSRLNRDEWETVIERYVTHEPSRWRDQVGVTWTQRATPKDKVTSSELLEHALGLEPGRWSQPDQRRVSTACQTLGWKVTTARVNGRPTRVWLVSESSRQIEKLPSMRQTSFPDDERDIPY